MVRVFSFEPVVGSAEGDAWGQLPPSGALRLFEQAAVDAAADAGYDGEWHRSQGTAWVIHRMTFLMGTPAHIGDRLRMTTWLSHVARVRAYREYRLENLAEPGASLVATGIAEWVYIDREKIVPRTIPPDIEEVSDTPGAPLGTYDPPAFASQARQASLQTERVAEWYECDSMGHVNNAVYADWLDLGVKGAMEEAGWPVATLKSEGLQLRGEFFALDYKRAAISGDRLIVATALDGPDGRLFRLHQTIRSAEGVELLEANCIYGWADNQGKPTNAPERRQVSL